MRPNYKKFVWIVLSLLSIILILVLIWHWNARRSLPDQSGIIHLRQIKESVSIGYNKWGTPSIWAENDHDLFFAMGWQHGADRLFQLELIRRVSQGRLAEIFGQDALNFDIRIRRIGLNRKADSEINDVDPLTKNFLQDYVDGINAYLEKADAFPPEFTLQGFFPEKWNILDVAIIYLYQTWFSNSLMDVESLDKAILDKFPDELKPFFLQGFDWSPETVSDNENFSLFKENSYPLRMGFASNAFAVAANKSATGKALLAADPHLQVNQLPGFWYTINLHNENGQNVSGISVPGLPLIAMGHNGAISWAFTVAAVDIIDYYSETISSDDSMLYRTPQKWERMTEVPELFYIKGEEDPVIKMFYITRHGVIVNKTDSSPIAMHWAGYDFSLKEMLPSLFALSKCSNFNSFKKTVTHFGALSANWLYADSSGNIGYQMGCPVPIRDYSNTLSLLPGDSSKYDWQGFWKLENTPHSYNPEKGWIASCNNQPFVVDDTNEKIPGFYDPYRIIRIDQLMNKQNKFTVEDLEQFQMDLTAPQVIRWKTLLAEMATKSGRPKLALRIENWDGNLTSSSDLPTLFYLWWEDLPIVFLQDEIENLPKIINPIITEALLTLKTGSWIDDLNTPETEVWMDIVQRAFNSALEKWKKRPWGEATTISFDHFLSKSPIVSLLLNWSRGPYPYHGSPSTLNANFFWYDRENDTFRVLVAPSMRMIVNFENIDSSSLQLPAGISGNPYSENYDNQIENWLNGDRSILPFSWSETVKTNVSGLILAPAGQ